VEAMWQEVGWKACVMILVETNSTFAPELDD